MEKGREDKYDDNSRGKEAEKLNRPTSNNGKNDRMLSGMQW